MFRALLEQVSADTNKRSNAVRDKSDRIEPWGKKSRHPTASNATSQATPNSAVGSQSFTNKDISDIRNDYL